jgi:hypothetical protein
VLLLEVHHRIIHPLTTPTRNTDEPEKKMSKTKQFHIGDILSVTDGKLVSPRHVHGIYDLLGWMTGEDLMTHQLPRASRECEDQLRADFPDLAEIEVPDTINSEMACLTFLASLETKYGTHRDVRKLEPEQHTQIDPISEIKMIRPDLPIMGIDI